MNTTIKVSIGTISFLLEEDAYRVLEEYLNSLKKHFETDDESDEIISDIEMRLSELLQMRQPNTDSIVTLDDVKTIIAIMGNPRDFENNEETNDKEGNTNRNASNKSFEHTPRKKLFRDVDNKVLGGVCGGFSHFFKTDVVVFRLLFAILVLLGIMLKTELAMLTGVMYLIFWIAMPKALTFEQKIQMTGTATSIHNITDRESVGDRKYKGSFVTKFIGVTMKVVLVVIGVFFALCLLLLLGVFIWLLFEKQIIYAQNYFDLLGLDGFNIKTAILAVCLLPLIGIINLVVKIYYRSAFKTQNAVLLSLGVVLWIVSGVYLTQLGLRFESNLRVESSVTKTILADTKSDTLHVHLDESYTSAIQQPSNPYLLYRNNNNLQEICVLPVLRICESNDSTLQVFEVKLVKFARADNRIKAEYDAESVQLNYTVRDSLMTINPQWHNKDNPWNIGWTEIHITTPKGKKVEMKRFPD